MAESTAIEQKVKDTLEKLFQQHRILFWYDEKIEMTSLYEAIQLDDVEKVIIENNEFGIKYRILVEHPTRKFLLYQAKARPDDHDNWLLDLLVSNHEFHTEPASLYLQDLDLPVEFKPLVQQHEAFFGSQDRIRKLKEILEHGDRETAIRIKLMSVVCGCDPEWERVLFSLFTESLLEKDDKLKSIQKFNLNTFLWELIEKKYAYKSNTPSIKDFILHLVHDHFTKSTASGSTMLNKEAYLFVNRWKENIHFRQLYQECSTRLETDLDIESAIQTIPLDSLMESDTFSVIDRKIIVGLRNHILELSAPDHVLQEWIQRRKTKFFFPDYAYVYEALSHASSLLDEIRKANFKIESPKDGFEKYEKQWYKTDRLYRKYIYASEQAGHQGVLKDLSTHIEKAYSNTYLLKLGDAWQGIVDKMNSWTLPKIMSQRQFYNEWVTPYVQSENRVFVIISDALRYESASELRDRIVREDRYTAKLSAVLGSIPSYTQLGMASLLPHDKLTFEEKSDIVYADGFSSQGTANRTKILQRRHAGSIAISAEDFLRMKASTEGRDFTKPYQIIYIYSNHIDKIGDDKASEGKVFDATEEEFNYLLKIIKQVNNMNGYNMIVTADHGYIYQHNKLDETDFTEFTASGIIYRSNRRFVLGRNLEEHTSVKKWTGLQLGFGDDTEVLIPKSINRIRIQGAGSRFVHGGSSLQEIVIPVLEINKARKSDVEKVDVDIISGSTNITSNTFAVNFYQKLPISDKVHPRQIQSGFYTGNGLLISDVVTLLFNTADRDTRAREKRQTFMFTSQASKYNGQDVFLRLEEKIEGTNQFKTYKQVAYRMLISFGSEFDEF